MSANNQKKLIIFSYLVYEMKGSKFNVKDLNRYANEIDNSISFKSEDMPLISDTVKEFNVIKKSKTEDEIKAIAKFSTVNNIIDQLFRLKNFGRFTSFSRDPINSQSVQISKW